MLPSTFDSMTYRVPSNDFNSPWTVNPPPFICSVTSAAVATSGTESPKSPAASAVSRLVA